MNRLAPLLVVALAFACGDSALNDTDTDPSAPDAATDASAGGMDAGDAGRGAIVGDSGVDAATTDAGDAATGCGDQRAPVADIVGTGGIAIAPNGTIYYSQSKGIGRRVVGGAPEPKWITGLGGTMWGLAYRDDGVLFAATPSVGGGTIYRIDTTAAEPTAVVLVKGVGKPNGLIVAADGAIFFSDINGGVVYRADDSGTATKVTESVSSPNGLFLDDDGALLVLSYNSREVVRVVLDAAWRESSSARLFSVTGNPDGIGKDAQGRYYVTDNSGGRLLQISADLSAQTVLLEGVGAAANVAFGRGALNCTDLYVASSGVMQVLDVGSTGRP